MNNQVFITASELAINLEISRSQAYRIVKTLNSELEKKGYMTLAGKVSRAYFEEKFYGVNKEVSLCQ